MRIDSLQIRRRYNGGYKCTVTIDGEFGAVTLNLDDKHTQRIVACVADLIVDSAKEVAETLSKQALDHTALEYQGDGAT